MRFVSALILLFFIFPPIVQQAHGQNLSQCKRRFGDGTSKIQFDKFVRGTINGGGSVLQAESENDDIRIRRRMTGLGERLGQEWNENLGKQLGDEWNKKLGPKLGQEWIEKLGEKLSREWNQRLIGDGQKDK